MAHPHTGCVVCAAERARAHTARVAADSPCGCGHWHVAAQNELVALLLEERLKARNEQDLLARISARGFEIIKARKDAK